MRIKLFFGWFIISFVFASIAGAQTSPPYEINLDFNDGNYEPLTFWRGNWSVLNGELLQSEASLEENNIAYFPYWYGDIMTDVDLKITSATNSSAWVGIKVQAQEYDNSDGYVCSFNAAGDVLISTEKDGLLYQATGAITNPTSYHHIKFETIGNTILVTLDNFPTWMYIDNNQPLLYGYITLINNKASVAYDNLNVISKGRVATYTPSNNPTPTPLPVNRKALYCPVATTGAGGCFLDFWNPELRDDISSFDELPRYLEEARAQGTDIVYLVDWWEGGYSNKGDYLPYVSLGGAAAFKRGIDAIHSAGGKIILYFEPFIIRRTSQIGLTEGANWAMKASDGSYYQYPGTGDDFYLMYPGEGSGWTEYLTDIIAGYARDYGIDGCFLDSYGLQWNWRDYNENHPGAEDPSKFNQGAIELVRLAREKMRLYVPDAFVLLEGIEIEPILEVSDGGLAGDFSVLQNKPWFSYHTYTVFTASYRIEDMKAIIATGYYLGLTKHWAAEIPSDSDIDKLKNSLGSDWKGKLQDFYKLDNILCVNGYQRPEWLDLDALDAEVQAAGASGTTSSLLNAAIDEYKPLLQNLRNTGYILPATYIKNKLNSSIEFTPTPTLTNTPPACLNGDVSCDSEITPNDALLAFQVYLSLYEPTGREICDVLCAADYNQDGSITPADALCIFKEYLGTTCL